jgi:hypothetical protein
VLSAIADLCKLSARSRVERRMCSIDIMGRDVRLCELGGDLAAIKDRANGEDLAGARGARLAEGVDEIDCYDACQLKDATGLRRKVIGLLKETWQPPKATRMETGEQIRWERVWSRGWKGSADLVSTRSS